MTSSVYSNNTTDMQQPLTHGQGLLPVGGGRVTLLLVTVHVLVVVVTGCGESSNSSNTTNRSFKQVEILGAYPARETATGWERVCGAEQPDGLMLNLALLAFQVEALSASATDKDPSIRPGDIIGGLVVEGSGTGQISLGMSGNVMLDIHCIDPLPDVDSLPASTGESCQGSAGGASVQHVSYVANSPERRDGHNIIIVLDESGSMQGLVNAEDNKEATSGSVGFTETSVQDMASDWYQQRHSAVEKLLTTFNVEDRVGIVAFGEGVNTEQLQVPCTFAEATGADALEVCFGTDKSVWDLDELPPGSEGRANLWQAVALAWDFLIVLDDTQRSNHIILVTDGPDTCSVSENLGNCQTACSSVGYEDITERVDAAEDDPYATPIHIHAVQFESPGYRGRDPRQLEVACRTGGHYQFINSWDMPSVNPTPLGDALDSALSAVRASVLGHWEVVVEAPGLASDGAAPTGSPRGALYGLSGVLTIRASSNLFEPDQHHVFGVGTPTSRTSSSNSWDRRPTVRKPCTTATDCGVPQSYQTDCSVVCSAETMLCPVDADWVDANTATICSNENGWTGICCEGVCLEAGEVCSVCW